MTDLELNLKRQVNVWRALALTLTGLIAIAFLVPQCLMEPGRNKSIEATDRLLQMAAKRDFDGMTAFASPKAIEFMRERDAKWGKVLKFSFEDSIVQIGGTPAWVQYQVWREKKNVREQFNCSGERVLMGFVTWPEAEEK